MCMDIPLIHFIDLLQVENRAEKAAKLNAFAVSQFHNHFALKTETEQRQKFFNATERVKEVQTIYRPYRKYKRKDAGPEDEQTRVRITLLEYGNKGKDILPHHLKADIGVKTASNSSAKSTSEENATETQRNDSVGRSVCDFLLHGFLARF